MEDCLVVDGTFLNDTDDDDKDNNLLLLLCDGHGGLDAARFASIALPLY
jgi:serine/threonine protein phosphatase PrpC